MWRDCYKFFVARVECGEVLGVLGAGDVVHLVLFALSERTCNSPASSRKKN